MEYSFTNNEHVLSGKTYDLILSYKPTFPNTSIKKLAPRKNHLKLISNNAQMYQDIR